MVSSATPPVRNQVDWKGELKRKLDQRAEKPKELAQVEATASPSEEPPDEPVESAPPTLFKYKLDRALRNSTLPSTQSGSRPKKKHVFEEPLIRRKPIRPLPQPPGQKTLHLQPEPSPFKPADELVEEELIGDEEERIPKEILFSRFLSGIVDLVLPLLMGFVFTIIASFLLGFDLFSQSSLKWIGLLALSFFFFNSLFFFLTSGQTPGMVATDLQLIGEDRREVTTASILLRVVFFLPSALTVIGLGWALFDPLCRCLHDLVSRTRIEPAS
jgi:uncharacterized RDD family membrane protein YckC